MLSRASFAATSLAAPVPRQPRVLFLGDNARWRDQVAAALPLLLPGAAWMATESRPAFVQQLLAFFPHFVFIDQALNTVAHGHPYLLLRRLYPAIPVILLGGEPPADGTPSWGVGPGKGMATLAEAWAAARSYLPPVQARISAMRIQFEIRRNVQALGDIEAGLMAQGATLTGSPSAAWLAEIQASIAYLEQLSASLQSRG